MESRDVLQKTHFIVVYGLVINDKYEVLMTQEAKESIMGLWFLPAGKVERFENLCAAVSREVHEETGMVFQPENMIHVDAGKGIIYVYFTGNIVGGTLKTIPDNESLSAAWVPISQIQEIENRRHFLRTNKLAKEGFKLRGPVMYAIKRALDYRKFQSKYSKSAIKCKFLPRTNPEMHLKRCQIRIALCRLDNNEFLVEKDSNFEFKLPIVNVQLWNFQLVIHQLIQKRNLHTQNTFSLENARILHVIYNGTHKEDLEPSSDQDGYLITVGLVVTRNPNFEPSLNFDLDTQKFCWIDPNQTPNSQIEPEALNLIRMYVECLSSPESVFLPTVNF